MQMVEMENKKHIHGWSKNLLTGGNLKMVELENKKHVHGWSRNLLTGGRVKKMNWKIRNMFMVGVGICSLVGE